MLPRRISPPDSGPGTTDHSLVHDGVARRFRVHLPPRLPVAAPVVLQLHGGGGNGVGLDRLTRFHQLADRERFVVVSPSGVDRRWNDGRGATRLDGGGADDVGFIAMVIDALAQRLPIDRSRVYSVGISNGAMMSARLAADLADRIAAIGQVAGTVAEDAPQWWHPDRPVPVIQIHGTADPIVPYEGGQVRIRRRASLGRVLGVDDWARLLAGHNRAAGPQQEQVTADATVRSWRGASGQGDLDFWRVDGAGHTWPGGTQYLPVSLIGPTSASFDATAVLWRFLSRHRLSV